MSGVFAGVRVIELAQFVYVPGAGAMMGDQGAEVIKIETIEGDPYRTMQAGGARHLGTINISMEQNNRNKKSVALDLKTEEGREALLKLVESADVFLTSLRPKAIKALRLDLDDLRARNPKIIYARGNGAGFRGAEADRPGYDASAFWARGGACYAFTRPGQQPTSPRPAYGDHTGSLAIAYGIAAALFKRAMTGEPSLVENSLLSTAAWVLSGDLTMTQLPDYQTHPTQSLRRALTYSYAARDGKMIQLMILNAPARWKAFCSVLGLECLIDDPRFCDDAARGANCDALIAILEQAFIARDFSEWQPLLESIDIPWELISSIHDVAADPQVHANGMMQIMDVDGTPVSIVAGPVGFDGDPLAASPRQSPSLGADTAALLSEAGYSEQAIAEMRGRGTVR